MDNNKLNFLVNDFPALLKQLKGDEKGQWGVMNAQQMIEHMSDSIKIANGKDPMKLHVPVEQVPAMKSFMMSDKEFRPNTKNALMSETPSSIRNRSIQDSVQELEKELADFVDYFQKNTSQTLTNPFFGELNFEEWVHLLDKHARHHLKQFNLL